MKESKNITPKNANEEMHGYWEKYWGDDTLEYKCFYKNDIEVGYEEWHINERVRKIYHII